MEFIAFASESSCLILAQRLTFFVKEFVAGAVGPAIRIRTVSLWSPQPSFTFHSGFLLYCS